MVPGRAGAGAGIGACAAGFVLALAALFAAAAGPTGQNPFETIELKTYDWRMARTARPGGARKDIVLVDIDEASLRSLEPNAGRWPWPRAVHSLVIDFLARAKPALIAYDINFAEADSRAGFTMGGTTLSGEESDRALIDSVKNAGNVILLADATFDGDVAPPPPPPSGFSALDADGIVERRVIFPPFAALAGAAAGLGHNLFLFDRDGPMRHAVPFVRSRGGALPSLGLAAALRAAGIAPSEVRLDGRLLRLGDRVMPLASNTVASTEGPITYLWALIDFRGAAYPRGATYETYSFFDLLYSNEQLLAGQTPDVDPAELRDKIVFVGTSASGIGDTFATPFALGKMAGVQIHAALADDVLSNRFMHPIDETVRASTVAGMGILAGAAATLLPVWWAVAATAALVCGFAAIGLDMFARGTWLNLTQPVLASSLAVFGGVAYQYLVEGREKRAMKRLFGRYVSKDVYAQLVANPGLAQLGGRRREMTVLFSDIRGFTTVTERGRAEEIVGMLNEYFTRMVDVVFRRQGTIDKFVGDMVMALFGAPLDDPRHADHAVEAALDMLDALRALNAQWAAEGRVTGLDIGIGINTGPMIAGNIGSEQIMSYTVIGDAVNLGARLESINKQYGTRIIISEATRAQLTGSYQLRPLGDAVVKGRTQPVAIFEVVGRAPAAGGATV
ncbi:MAG: adenylate/guanylate cyclase domain-containing protein [Acidobacteria bacterium]|nr:adenylate/guanylate cyclase domain-containing protein [Acidobacteriota bacterium]